jgi:4-hydroxy-L-threonine phosphate dehydrogenase PdxA
MNKLIAITIGDIKGVGINLLIKLYNKKKINNFILFTNIEIFKKNIKFPFNKINLINDSNINNYNKKKLNIYSFETKNINTNTLDALNVSYKFTNKKKFIGILTLPLNKNKINKYVTEDFIDQTTYFSRLEKVKDSNMIFFYNNKFFVPLTIHIQLKNVFKHFKNKKKIIKKIISLHSTLKNDFKIENPKIILAGINPHAGENGIISKDEIYFIKPILKNLAKNNIHIVGPVSGDSIMSRENLYNYNTFIFSYHDQALIPFKMISKFEGVNYTSNLSIIRVSPSHGTAEKLINKKNASSKGILNCFKLIKKISKNRI